MADQEAKFTIKEGGTDGNSWRLESRKVAVDGSNCDIWVSPKGRTAHVCVSTSDTTGVEVRSIAWKNGAGRAACDAYQAELMKAHSQKVAVEKSAETPKVAADQGKGKNKSK